MSSPPPDLSCTLPSAVIPEPPADVLAILSPPMKEFAERCQQEASDMSPSHEQGARMVVWMAALLCLDASGHNQEMYTARRGQFAGLMTCSLGLARGFLLWLVGASREDQKAGVKGARLSAGEKRALQSLRDQPSQPWLLEIFATMSADDKAVLNKHLDKESEQASKERKSSFYEMLRAAALASAAAGSLLGQAVRFGNLPGVAYLLFFRAKEAGGKKNNRVEKASRSASPASSRSSSAERVPRVPNETAIDASNKKKNKKNKAKTRKRRAAATIAAASAAPSSDVVSSEVVAAAAAATAAALSTIDWSAIASTTPPTTPGVRLPRHGGAAAAAAAASAAAAPFAAGGTADFVCTCDGDSLPCVCSYLYPDHTIG